MLITARGNDICLLGLKITDRIPNHGHLEKRRYPNKWTEKLFVYYPECRHTVKGSVPEKLT